MQRRRINLSIELEEFTPSVADIIVHINGMALEGLFLLSGYRETPQMSVAGSLLVPNMDDDTFRELHDSVWEACMETDSDNYSFAGILGNEIIIPVPGNRPELYLQEFTLKFKGKNIEILLTVVSKETCIKS